MTILPKKKSSSGKDGRQSGSHEAPAVAGQGGAPDYGGEGAVGAAATGGRPVPSFGNVPEPNGAGRRLLTMEANLEADAPSVGRKRQAVPNAGRQDRSTIRCKQRNSGHVLPSTSTAPTSEGYNSEDEVPVSEAVSEDVEFQAERTFEAALKAAKGFVIKKMRADGACMFRAVADQVYGDQDMHNTVRTLCISYMKKNADYFSQFVTENFNDYLTRKSNESAHGNHVELQAMAELYNRPIEVYQYSTTPMNTFFAESTTGSAPIRLSYHRSSHYNSVVDPYNATIGVGLGMPQFYPGLADRNLMRDAALVSEQDAIEQAMLKDKLLATDWEATDAQLQEQVACASYLQWLADEKKRREQNKAPGDGANSSSAQTPPSSPSCEDPVKDAAAVAAENMQMMPWCSEDDLLNHVLALSSQEYIDSLKEKGEEAACCSKSQKDEGGAGCSSSDHACS